MKTSEWYAIYICSNCKNRLYFGDRSSRYALCPHCGGISGKDSNIVILRVREHKHHKWYQFWKRKYTYEGLDTVSKEWLSKQ